MTTTGTVMKRAASSGRHPPVAVLAGTPMITTIAARRAVRRGAGQTMTMDEAKCGIPSMMAA
jgi:hypothetical protein